MSVKWRLLGQTVDELREAFADVPADALRDLIDEAVAEVRKGKQRKRNSGGGETV